MKTKRITPGMPEYDVMMKILECTGTKKDELEGYNKQDQSILLRDWTQNEDQV